jgi:signal transduction histidine kinase
VRAPLIGSCAGILGALLASTEGLGPWATVAGAVVGAAFGLVPEHPRAAWLVTALATAAIAPIGWPATVAFFGAAHAFVAGRREGKWSGLVALAALVGSSLLGALIEHETVVPAVLIPGAVWGMGRALRDRELVAAQLAERGRELEEEREAHAALSVRYERARIASELHDIVAHAISVMVIQASAGQRLTDDPKATAETFGAIAGAARQAEEDMGRLVALLADEDAIGPAPDLALVEELIARASGSGLDVTLRLEGEREGLSADVVQAAYHVVREGLTNVLRYAAGASVAVVVRGERRLLAIEVENAPAERETALAGAGTGTGLIGLRERVAALGGTLEAGPSSGGGWRITARLPRTGLIPAGETASQVHPAG